MKQRPARTQRRRRPASETREHVLDVAHELFYWTGIRATGIDRVAADAGVAPTALYRAFPSKDELVAAYVERAERRYQQWFDHATADDGRSPAERILSLFDALGEQVRPAVCRGCPFSMALTEFPDEEVAAHRTAVRLKEWVRGRLHRLANAHAASRDEVVDASLLGDHLTLLFEGVYASVQALGARGPAKRARQAVASLLGAS
jgi:AcrR family transcriptional regulator